MHFPNTLYKLLAEWFSRIRYQVRCASCGGHLGDVFADGVLFQGTPAAVSGKRYCIDGAALVFVPQDGSEQVVGEGAVKQPELPSWLQPPPVGKKV